VRCGHDDEKQADRVYDHVALAACHLLARVVPAAVDTDRLRGAYRLRVDDRGGRIGVPALGPADLVAQVILDGVDASSPGR
jgi:hypothetical protein